MSRHLPGPTTLNPRLGQQPPALLGGNQQFLADLGHFVEHLTQARARHTHQPRWASRDAGHDHRAAGQQVDVTRKVSRPVGHDVPVAIRGVEDFYRSGLDHEQIEIGITGAEYRLAVLEDAAVGQRGQGGQFIFLKSREGNWMRRSGGIVAHGSIVDPHIQRAFPSGVCAPKIVEPMDDLLNKESNGLAEPVSLLLSDAALGTFQQWMAEIEPRRRPDADLGHIQGWASKLDGAVARIAGLLHLAERFTGDWRTPVSDQTLISAISVGNYLIDHALAVFDEMGADPARDGARIVLAWIQREHLTAFTKRECHRSHRARFRRPTDLDPILDLLVEFGYIRELASPLQVGRPSRRFAVNPQTWGQNGQDGQKG